MGSFRIVTLNIHSLSDKIEDLRQDKVMLMSNMICLTETWLKSDIAEESFTLPGYDLHLNSYGVGE